MSPNFSKDGNSDKVLFISQLKAQEIIRKNEIYSLQKITKIDLTNLNTRLENIERSFVTIPLSVDNRAIGYYPINIH